MDLQSEVSNQSNAPHAYRRGVDRDCFGGFDPTAPVRVTTKNTVALVTRVADRTTFDVSEWLPTLNMGELHTLRPEIRSAGVRKEYPFICAACGEPVVLKAYTDYGHYFSHLEKHRAEQAGCPFRESRDLSQEDLDRIRYHGQREGARHVRTKVLIERTLRADPRFDAPKIETTWRSFLEGWRRPDVSSKWDGLPVVFEAQVSNTYPQIVAERTEFYRRDGALLVWIFDRRPDETWRTLHADAFCANQQHLFVVDEESAAESERQGIAFVRSYSLRPDVRPVKSDNSHRTLLEMAQSESFELVPFNELKLDVERQTACRFDVKLEERRSRHKVLCAAAQANSQMTPLKEDLMDIRNSRRPVDEKALCAWAALVCAIESARLGCAVGTGLANAAGVLNLVYDHYPSVVGLLVGQLRRLNLDTEEIQRGAWGKRTAMVRSGNCEGKPLPEQHLASRKMLAWLYD